MKCAGEFNMIANEKMKQINDEIDKMEKVSILIYCKDLNLL